MSIIVYIWYDGKIPFYVGIGKPGRELEWRKRNPHCYAKRKSAESKGTFSIKILYTELSWEEAYKIERSLIKEIGLLNNNTGTLTNYAEGGNGGNVQLGWTSERKEEFKLKMKKINSSRPKSSYGAAKDSIWITNGEISTRIPETDLIPEGWIKGRGKLHKPYYWITDGNINAQIPLYDPIPLNQGWSLGQTKTHYRGKSLIRENK